MDPASICWLGTGLSTLLGSPRAPEWPLAWPGEPSPPGPSSWLPPSAGAGPGAPLRAAAPAPAEIKVTAGLTRKVELPDPAPGFYRTPWPPDHRFSAQRKQVSLQAGRALPAGEAALPLEARALQPEARSDRLAQGATGWQLCLDTQAVTRGREEAGPLDGVQTRGAIPGGNGTGPRNPSVRGWDPGMLACTLAARLTLHADLWLGREQVLWAGRPGSASLHLPAVPSLDGDGGSVHLVDKPAGGRAAGLRTEARPVRLWTHRSRATASPPPRPPKA